MAFLQHTSFLCLSFGALFSIVSPRLNAMFDAHFSTVEALTMVRHFGLAMMFLGTLCRAVDGDAQPELVSLLIAWHAAVMGAWAVEFFVLGAFCTCPLFTRASVYSGALVQFMLLCEGLLEVGPDVRMLAAASAAIAAVAAATSAGQSRGQSYDKLK